ncbi:MAG: Na+/H+ antiporter subunit E [Chloroflexi bacterium]|nr:Na+/H+ antiporter subunit E [Chloroflexota bacterium]
MNLFLLHLALVTFWVALIGSRPEDFAVGFIFGYFTILIGDNLWYPSLDHEPNEFRIYPIYHLRNRKRFEREMRLLFSNVISYAQLGFYYIRSLVISTLVVIAYVLRIRDDEQPGIIAMPVYCRRTVELVMLNALITMSPGTLGVDERTIRLDDGTSQKMLYVHCLHVPDRDAKIEELMQLQDVLLKAMRWGNIAQGRE